MHRIKVGAETLAKMQKDAKAKNSGWVLNEKKNEIDVSLVLSVWIDKKGNLYIDTQ